MSTDLVFGLIQVYEARIAHAAIRVKERAPDCRDALASLTHSASALCAAALPLRDVDADARCARAERQRTLAACSAP